MLVRCFVGGHRHEELVSLPDDELVEVIRQELRQVMGVRAQPVLTRIYRWPQANPQYDVGHLERVDHLEALAADLPGLYLTGSAYRGVGIPDCIQQGEETAAAVVAAISEPQPVTAA